MTKQNFVADTIWQRVFFVALDTMFCLELDFQISSKPFGNKIFHLATKKFCHYMLLCTLGDKLFSSPLC